VQDSTGARINSASIELRSRGSSLVCNAFTDRTGQLLIDDLPPGTYMVSVAARGFTTASAEVSIVVSGIRDIRITLAPAVVPQTIGV
jgi:hypothetical protein